MIEKILLITLQGPYAILSEMLPSHLRCPWNHSCGGNHCTGWGVRTLKVITIPKIEWWKQVQSKCQANNRSLFSFHHKIYRWKLAVLGANLHCLCHHMSGTCQELRLGRNPTFFVSREEREEKKIFFPPFILHGELPPSFCIRWPSWPVQFYPLWLHSTPCALWHCGRFASRGFLLPASKKAI